MNEHEKRLKDINTWDVHESGDSVLVKDIRRNLEAIRAANMERIRKSVLKRNGLKMSLLLGQIQFIDWWLSTDVKGGDWK